MRDSASGTKCKNHEKIQSGSDCHQQFPANADKFSKIVKAQGVNVTRVSRQRRSNVGAGRSLSAGLRNAKSEWNLLSIRSLAIQGVTSNVQKLRLCCSLASSKFLILENALDRILEAGVVPIRYSVSDECIAQRGTNRSHSMRSHITLKYDNEPQERAHGRKSRKSSQAVFVFRVPIKHIRMIQIRRS